MDGIKHSKPKQSAFDKAVGIIARRMRTEKQVRDSLLGPRGKSGGYPVDEIDDAIERLKELGYIDDRAYAERFLEILIGKRRGRRRVKDEMRGHGLDAALIEDIVGEGYSEETERDNALAVASKAIETLPEDMDRRKKAQKLSSRLIARGYDYDIVNSVVDAVIL